MGSALIVVLSFLLLYHSGATHVERRGFLSPLSFSFAMSQKSTVVSVAVGAAIGGVVAFAFMKWKESSDSSKSFVEPPPVTFLESVPSE